jgi:hypothetical protein
MPLRWRNKLRSEVPGQSGHPLPDRSQPLWAKRRHQAVASPRSHCSKSLASVRPSLKDAKYTGGLIA